MALSKLMGFRVKEKPCMMLLPRYLHLHVQYKNYDKLVSNTQKRSRLRDTENNLVVTSEEREAGRGKIGMRGKEELL